MIINIGDYRGGRRIPRVTCPSTKEVSRVTGRQSKDVVDFFRASASLAAVTDAHSQVVMPDFAWKYIQWLEGNKCSVYQDVLRVMSMLSRCYASDRCETLMCKMVQGVDEIYYQYSWGGHVSSIDVAIDEQWGPKFDSVSMQWRTYFAQKYGADKVKFIYQAA